MAETDGARFQTAQAHYRLSGPEREFDLEGADAWRWLQQLCRQVIERRFAERKAIERRLAKRSARRRQDRNDLADEVWVALLGKLPTLKCGPDRADITPWLDRIVRRILYALSRRREPGPLDHLDEPDELPAPDESAGQQCADLGDELREALDVLRPVLGPKNHELIRLRWLERWPLKRAAAHVGLSVNAAKCRQRWCFKKLRALLRSDSRWPLVAQWIETHSRKTGTKFQNSSHLSAPGPQS